MDHFIEVKEIEISNLKSASLVENYPESGFWLVRSEESSDLAFVNKDQSVCFFICPEHIYKSMGIDFPVLPKQEEITNMSTFYNNAPGYVSEEFVKDFAKLLLNSKK